MCGFSGLPKFRQLVSPSGSAPTQARFAAHSSTASTAPRYGSQATRRPLPSIETAIAPSPGSLSTAASASSGRRGAGGVGALGGGWGARADEPVVLLEERAARADVRRAQQLEQDLV